MNRGLVRYVGLLVLVVAASCRTVQVGPEAGATSSSQAVAGFLSAARAQDLQAMSAMFGNAESPARDRIANAELEQRLLIMLCFLKHDEGNIGGPQPGEAGRVLHRVEMKQAAKSANVMFTAIRNRRTGRWFVESFDMNALQAFCQPRGTPSGE